MIALVLIIIMGGNIQNTMVTTTDSMESCYAGMTAVVKELGATAPQAKLIPTDNGLRIVKNSLTYVDMQCLPTTHVAG